MAEYYKKKVLILGDGSVGKTSLIRRYVVDKFSDDYITTIGAKTTKKDLSMSLEGTTWNVSLLIWDVLGQKGYTEVQTDAFQGAKGVLLAYDVSRPETRGSLVDYWIPRVWKVVGKIPMILLANKADLATSPAEEEQQVQTLAALYDCPGYLTSAKTGQNVEDAFLALARALLARAGDRTAQMDDVLVAGDVRPELVSLADRIIADFCREFGDVETAMPIVKQQFIRAGVDVKAPSRDALLRAVDQLARVEAGFKPADRVAQNRSRRIAWLRGAN